MTFTATPQPSDVPPRVRLDVDSDDAGAVFTSLVIKRDGIPVRQQPYLGGAAALAFDYEAPFGVLATYTAEGAYLPGATADFSETWASVAAWTGSGFSASGGKAVSTTLAASIKRTASGTIQKVSVSLPDYVRIELLTAGDVLVASVQVDTQVTAVGTTTQQVTGLSSFTATLLSGTMSVVAADASWATSVSYTGTPTKIQVVSLYPTVVPSITWSSPLGPHGVWGDVSGNIYIATNDLVRKFDASGVQTLSFSTTGSARSLWVDTSGNIFITDVTNTLVRKYNAAGTQTATWSTVANAFGIWGDTSGNIFTTDSYTVRKFNSGGTQIASWSAVGLTNGIWGDTSGNIFTADGDNKVVRKFNSGGTQIASWTTTHKPVDIWGDTTGNIFVTTTDDAGTNLVRKFNSAGTQLASWSTVGQSFGIWGDTSGNIFITDYYGGIVRKFVPKTNASVDDIAAYTPTPALPFSATVTTHLDVDQAWLISPTQPSLSCPIDDGPNFTLLNTVYVDSATATDKTSKAQRTLHEIVGRRMPIAITNGPRSADEWSLVLGAPTVALKNTLRALFDDQTPLLLRAPNSFAWDLPDGWYSAGDITVARFEVPMIDELTTLTTQLTPVDSPAVHQGAVRTYGSVLIENADYATIQSKYASYLDLLAG